MSRSLRLAIGIVLLLWTATGPVLSQTSGDIRGYVRDAQGDGLPGVLVTATSESRGQSRTVFTTGNGSYTLGSLPVDVYTVTAGLEGFPEQSIEGVRVSISSTVNLNLELVQVAVTEEIVVSAVPVLDSTSSSVGSNYGSDFLEKLPTQRQFWDIMAVSPGISQASENSTAFSAFGSSTASNSWSVDGLNTTNADTGGSFWWINPDTIEEVQVLAIGAPAQYGNMSGAALNVVTKSGTNEFKGSVHLWYQDDSLTSENAEINGIPFERDEYHDAALALGGPIKRDRVWFFAAYQNYRDTFSEAGVDPTFPSEFPSDKYDIKISAALSDTVSMEAKYHDEKWPWISADPFSTPDAFATSGDTNPAWGIGLDWVAGTKHLFELNYAGYEGTDSKLSATGSTRDPFIDYSPPDGGPARFSEGILFPYLWVTGNDQIDATLTTHADEFLGGDHSFKFGVTYGQGEGDTITTGGLNGRYYYRYEYTSEYYGYEYTTPYYYRVTARAYHYGAESDTLSAFIDDSWRATEKLTINIGVRYDDIRSDIPDYPLLGLDWSPTGEVIPGVEDIVTWTHISPRLGLAYQIGEDGVLRAFYGKFFDGNVLGNWYAPPPQAPTYIYESSSSLDGPWTQFSTFEWPDNTIDPNIEPPETDQYTIGYEHRVARNLTLGLQGIWKDARNLIGWEILDDGVYEMVPWRNPFTGEIQMLASIVEQPTVRKGNRPGPGSLAPPGRVYEQDFSGAFLELNKRYSNGWSLRGSYTWSDSNGFLPRPLSQGQGDPFYTSTSGRDPNNWINAEQALQNEREHVFQLQGAVDLPWNLLASGVFRYLDGKPFSRQLTVGVAASRAPLSQGGQTIIAIPAESGTTTPDQVVLDFSLGRDFTAGQTRLRLDLQVFNAFNEDSHDWWETLLVPPGSNYVPSGYIIPRRLAIHLGVNF